MSAVGEGWEELAPLWAEELRQLTAAIHLPRLRDAGKRSGSNRQHVDAELWCPNLVKMDKDGQLLLPHLSRQLLGRSAPLRDVLAAPRRPAHMGRRLTRKPMSQLCSTGNTFDELDVNFINFNPPKKKMNPRPTLEFSLPDQAAR